MNPPPSPPSACRPFVPTFYGPTSHIYDLHKCLSNMDVSFKFPSAFCVCSYKNLGFSDAAPPGSPHISGCRSAYVSPLLHTPAYLCFSQAALFSFRFFGQFDSSHGGKLHSSAAWTHSSQSPLPPFPLQSPTSRFSKSISVWRQ